MTYWLYKCNAEEGGPSGYAGDWLRGVFSRGEPTDWGGDYSTLSPEVSKHLAEDVAAGDVVAAYQTDSKSVVGFCTVARLTGEAGDRTIFLQPIHWLTPAFPIHERKVGTPLEHSVAVNGPAAFRELSTAEMTALVTLSGAPERVLEGKPPRDGWKPVAVRNPADLVVPLEDVWAGSGRGYYGLEESLRMQGVLIKPKVVTFFANLDDLNDYVSTQVGGWEADGYHNTVGEWSNGTSAQLVDGAGSGMTVTYEPFTYLDASTPDIERRDD
ncbi:hypothetical protein OCS65_13020 [Rhodococcus aetherivorans]|uniref:Uncharacterized protein n=1 Tax=Rhodococcus aetherivorans TaxID=191292 RepID=A0AA46SG15_9NOCA|nr:hypothetical protein [Rhodococcus aetherivorans]UYF96604.1 hypothetical protein OCS65_13020 [Rhodococcus aetherivorans]